MATGTRPAALSPLRTYSWRRREDARVTQETTRRGQEEDHHHLPAVPPAPGQWQKDALRTFAEKLLSSGMPRRPQWI